MSKFLNTAFALVAGATLTLGAPGAAVAQEDPIPVGVMLPLTGPAALAGTSILEGIEFAAEEANAAGGALGRQIELHIEDDEANTSKGVTAVRRLIEQDGVVAISGTYVSAVALAASEIAREMQVPMVSAGSTSSAVTDANEAGDPWFFRAFPGSREQAMQSASDVVDKLDASRVAVLHENSTYGSSLADGFKKDIEAAGGEVISIESYNAEERDFYSVLTQVRSQQPDAIYIAGLMDAGAQIIRQSAELGLDTQIVGSGSMMSDKLIELAGPASEGFAVSSMFEPETPNEKGLAFAARFREKFDREPDVYSALGYDSMSIIVEAIERAGVAEGPAIQDALVAMDDFAIVQGPADTVANFDDQGSNPFKIGLALVENGRRVWLPFD
ncbi:penicillin-binding protein activator [Sulfitobacter sp.]|uniref:ABC transporter substrate-binding protein n=1 Tax=Sulfitobacter sp. TaxID=1903071 RepID=UPI003298F651